ncbi:VCBS repeat-containing protein [Porifericola rhodea]|uniref:VCBS repeat-containing protein n=1 Tax=Porifericola rhodea TaxID=930972 RepID=UPI002665A4C2|nr:VCBS repeat-containing protein [Porifericola rhodea]WKN32885.1 VCBS repeat-containing protein [Porifericola rhodea]
MRYTIWFIAILLISCTGANDDLPFTKMASSHTGISFENELQLTKDFDVFRYRNYYNGGGVAIGDVNNDGYADVYLTANMEENKLFLNKGNQEGKSFKFEDISSIAKVGGNKVWSTGVSMADINGDGLLDIYVCNSGDISGGKRENELFINQGANAEGIPVFEEMAADYGLDDKGFSTHAVFFDYDKDGDLDAYVLNNSFRPVSTLGLENIRHVRDSTGGDKLYRNDSNKFTDVSTEAGIYGSVIGFGLGVTISDVDQDGWMDIYVSNDFFERDYLYINQGDGTFKDELPQRMGHISHFSMGADAADLNNDGYPEIFVTDMLPESDERLKTMTHYESYDLHQTKLNHGYYEQYMRNTMQLNTQHGAFKEVGQFAGVDATDWSWGALIADFDNDAHKEIFVSNGVFKDVTNQDFIAYIGSDEAILEAMRKESIDFQELVDRMPSNKLSNYLFKQTSGLQFENVSEKWGLNEPSFSNGAAYGDLDNDGDLDLIVNNVNQEVFVYRNNSEKHFNNNYIKLSLKGPDKNTFGVGARVHAYTTDQHIMLENIPTKGFQSSMDYAMLIGMDSLQIIDSLIIQWGYDDKVQKLYNVQANQHLTLNIQDAHKEAQPYQKQEQQLFEKKEDLIKEVFQHKEDLFVDFDYQRLIYHMLSKEGPALAVGDINDDGLDDFFVGGAAGQAGSIYVQNKSGQFELSQQLSIQEDSVYEDVDATFFDANNDGNLDLYVVSGGNAFRENAPEYQDRLYMLTKNKQGELQYVRSTTALPLVREMGACVKPADYDNDGDLDLFIGNRGVPLKYGLPATSRILNNDGQGKFEDVTATVSPRLNTVGMVTDAEWVDFDNDDDLDLAIVGDWMPLTLLKNNGANLERLNNVPGLTQTNGWWKSIHVADINKDGEQDFVLGNWGTNTMFEASKEKPLELYINDFDQNETIDHIYATYKGDSLYPMALRHDLIMQLTYLKKDYLYYEDYAGKTLQQVFSPEQLSSSIVNKVHHLKSSLVLNNGDGSYTIEELPDEAQFSPIYAISEVGKHAGSTQLVMAGNFSGVKPEEGRYDANTGLLLHFQEGKALTVNNSGFNIKGEVRDMKTLRSIKGKVLLLIAKNNDTLEIYEYQDNTADKSVLSLSAH